MAVTVPTSLPGTSTSGVPLVSGEPRLDGHTDNVVGQEHRLRSRLRVLCSFWSELTEGTTTYATKITGPVGASPLGPSTLTFLVRAADARVRVTVTDGLTSPQGTATVVGAVAWASATVDVSGLTGELWDVTVELRADVTSATLYGFQLLETTLVAATIR